MNPIILAPTTLMRAQPLEYIDAAVQAGYEGIAMRLYPSPGMFYAPIVGNPQLMRDVKSALANSPLKVYESLTCYLQPEMDLEAMQHSLEYAAEIGVQWFLVIGDDADWNRMVDNFGRLCDIGAGYGLTASIEAPVNTRVVNSLPMALKLIEDSGRQNAVIDIDPVQFWRAGHSPDMLIGQDPRLFPYTQICDGVENRPMAPYCMPGEGNVPLYEILDNLPAGLPLSLEYHLRDDTITPAQWAKHVLDGTRRFLEGYYASKESRSAAV